MVIGTRGGGGEAQKYTITDQMGWGFPSEAQAGEIVYGHIDSYGQAGYVFATQKIWHFGDNSADKKKVPSNSYMYELPMGRGAGTYLGFIMPPSDVVVTANMSG